MKTIMLWIYVLFRSISLAIVLSTSLTTCFWPASYQVHLQHEENFEFTVDFEEPEEDEMEMFKEDEIISHNLKVDENKLERLHKHYQKCQIHGPEEELRGYSTYYRPTNDDYRNDESMQLSENKSDSGIGLPLPPYYGELIVHKNHIAKSRAVHTSASTSSNISLSETDTKLTNASLDTSDGVESEYYDYAQFKEEYYDEVHDEIQSNQTYNYTDEGKPEETVKDSFKKIIEIKKPKNCTKEEASNFGLEAVECLADDYQHAQSKEDKTNVLQKVITIIGIWLIIVCIVITILWCKFGWCCCCCVCCSLCRPKMIIQEAKKYVALNPPGVLVLSDGSTRYFEPSIYEVQAYDVLLRYARDM